MMTRTSLAGMAACALLLGACAAKPSTQTPVLVQTPPRVVVVADPQLTELLAPLVQLLSSQYAELRRQEESIDKLNGQLRDAQRRIEQLNEKLEALKNIERSLSVRPAAGAPK